MSEESMRHAAAQAAAAWPRHTPRAEPAPRSERQSRADSLMEALTNIVIGIIISTASNCVVMPLVLGVHISARESVALAVVYTAISLARQYVLRRSFNGRSPWQAIKARLT